MIVADVTVVIPNIPTRRDSYLVRALESVKTQTVRPRTVDVITDDAREGAPVTRTRGVMRAETEWLAFLDDDDELLPMHIERLFVHQERTSADVVYPWFHIRNPRGMDCTHLDPLNGFNRPFDAERLRGDSNFIPVTVLARTELIRDVGGFHPRPGVDREAPCEDWDTWLRCLDAGATFSHLPERTWIWNWHGFNTSGRPDRW